MQKLNQELENGGILISAPAGNGKSTLLSSWLNRVEMPLVHQGVRVGRLNLGECIGGAGHKPQECQLIQPAADGVARFMARFTHDKSQDSRA